MAKPTALVAVDGVLRKPVSRQPLAEGIKLLRTMADHYTLILALDAADDAESARTREWLEEHGLIQGTAFASETPPDGRVGQARSLRRQGYPLDLVVEPDPAQAEQLFLAGFTVLTFMHPSYARPEWRPGEGIAGPMPWDQLVDRVTKDRSERAVDVRHHTEDDE